MEGFGGETSGKLERPRSGWEDNVQILLPENGWGYGLDYLA